MNPGNLLADQFNGRKIRHARYISGIRHVDQKEYRHNGGRPHLDDPDTPDFHLAGDFRRRLRHKAVVFDEENSLVIGRKQRAFVNQPDGEVGFAAAGGAAQYNPATVKGNGCGMDRYHNAESGAARAPSQSPFDIICRGKWRVEEPRGKFRARIFPISRKAMFENMFASSGGLPGLAADLFAIIAPVFICAAIGYVWARRGMPFDNEFTTILSSNIAMPCLIVATLARLEIGTEAFSQMAFAGLITVVATIAAAAAVLKLTGLSQQIYLPSVVFGNTGNIGLPLCLFAFGEEGLALAIVFFTVFLVIQFTFGIWVSAGHGSIGILLRTPLVWAALVGMSLQLLGIHLPIWIDNTIGLIGNLAIPLMLLTLGVSLAKLKVTSMGRSVGLSVGRLAIGLAVGLAVAELLGMEGAARGILILESTMPVAVLNYLFAARYDRSPEEVAGLVLVSTAISFITLPGLLLLVL